MIIDGHVYLGHTVYIDYGVDDLLSDMDRLGITKTVVTAPPPGPFYHEANQLIEETVQSYEDSLIGLFKANPQHDVEAEKVEEALESGIYSGIDLDPTNDGYGVGSSIMDPIVDVAGEYNVPVYVHSGDSIFCPPEAVARYASETPDVNFITSMSRRAPEASMDVDNLYLLSNPFPALAFQRGRADRYPVERLIFASEAPLGSQDVELTAVEQAGLEEEVRDMILGGTLLKLLK
ncbi:MAG: amidohydrolase family protein [Candidatus Bathyarchaeia archaeon]